MSSYKPKYEMVYELDKNKIKKIEFKDNINYLKTENNYILKIYCENLEKYLLIRRHRAKIENDFLLFKCLKNR